jgi:ABC-2 type transport system permease protein
MVKTEKVAASTRAGAGDDPTGRGEGAQRSGPVAARGDFLSGPAHQEDGVVDAEGDQEQEPEQQHRLVGAWEPRGVEDQCGAADRGAGRQQHAAEEEQRPDHRVQQGARTGTTTARSRSIARADAGLRRQRDRQGAAPRLERAAADPDRAAAVCHLRAAARLHGWPGQQDRQHRQARLELDPRQAGWLFIGMATFTYTYLHVQKMFWRLLAEIQAGTLEQTYLSPLPSWVHVVGGRVLAAIAETTVVVAVMYAVTSLAVPLGLHWRLDSLVPLALLVTGAAGLALIIAGITLVWKRIQMLNDLVLLSVLFFSGAVLPLAEMPGWAKTISTPLFMTHTVAGLRTVMLDGHSLTLGGTSGLAWMLATTAAWFIAGLLVFRERTAQRRGTLSHA